jgi:hypothetical protein
MSLPSEELAPGGTGASMSVAEVKWVRTGGVGEVEFDLVGGEE